MSSLSLQAGQIRAALLAAGIPAAAATNVANILGNAAQTMRHSGAIIHDRTPPGLRMLDPGSRKHSLTNVDFRQGDPDFRDTRLQASENAVRPTQESAVRGDLAPQQTKATNGVVAGPFVSVASDGGAAKVGLLLKGEGDILFADQRGNTLVARRLQTQAYGLGGTVRFSAEPDGQDLTLKLLIDADGSLGSFERDVEVITDIRIASDGLVLTKRRVSGYFGAESATTLPTPNIAVVTDISLGAGLLANRALIQVLGVGEAAPSSVPTADCEE